MDAQTDKSPASTTDTMSAAIAAMEAVDASAPADDGEVEVPAVEAAPPAEEPATDAPAPEPEKPISPQMAALAKREKRVVEREAKLKAELAAREKAIAEKAEALGSVDAIAALARSSNAKALAEKLGLDKDALTALAKALWYEGVGEEAPPDVRAAAEAREIRENQARLERELAEERKARLQEREQARVDGIKRSYAAAIDAHVKTSINKYPLLASFAEENPAEVAEAMFAHGIEYAMANPSEHFKTPDELAAVLEEQLEIQVAPLKKRGFLQVSPKAITTSEPEARAPSALTNQRAATASKKRAADLSDEERFKAALKAMDEASAARG